jgi:hypothetical protein
MLRMATAAFIMMASAGIAAEKLRVGVNLTTIETVPIYLAAEGLDVALAGGAIPALTGGKVDVVTNAETQAILRSTERPDIRVILTVAEYGYRIVARRSAGVGAASDLRGKRIATSLNSSAHFYIVKTLRGVGLSEKDVTVVGMLPNDMPAALARGDVDGVSIWEPAAERSLQALGADAQVINGPAYRERFNLNTTTAVLADPGSAQRWSTCCGASSGPPEKYASAPSRRSSSWQRSSMCRCRSCRPRGPCSTSRPRSGMTCSTPCSSKSPGWPRSRTGHRGRGRRSPR